jgi:pyroglutamyl-peptidase
MKILLTGFGPFGNVADNPSARVVAQMARSALDPHALDTRILPVSYRRADEEITALLRKGRYDVALLLGVAGGADRIRLEIFGRNRSSTTKRDADDDVTQGRVRETGPAALPASSTVRGIVSKLKAAGIAARISRTAGDYVCNHTYYAALDTIAALDLPTRCLFMHVPCDELTLAPGNSAPTMPFERQVRAVEIVLSRLTG